MKIAILCAHSKQYQPLAELTVYANKGDYAKRHGYELIVRTTVDEKYREGTAHAAGITWDRLDYLVQLLKEAKYDWIYCVGADTLITNYTIPLESFIDENFSFIISSDWCSAVQADSFLVRCNPDGILFLEKCLGKFKELRMHPWVEQQAMIELLPQFKHFIKILPQRALNSYDYKLHVKMYPNKEKVRKGLDYYGNDGQWQKGDFLIHWPGLGFYERMGLADYYRTEIVQ